MEKDETSKREKKQESKKGKLHKMEFKLVEDIVHDEKMMWTSIVQWLASRNDNWQISARP